MKKLYEKSEPTFALVWIAVYCVLQSLANPLNEIIGTAYAASAAFCVLQTIVLFVFIRRNGLQKRAISREGKPMTFLLHYSPACRVIPSPATGTELFSGRHMDEGEPLELKGWDVKILEGDL